MSIQPIKKILVVGAGQMGHQIAMCCALAGYETILQDVQETALQQAKKTLHELMNQWVIKQKITTLKKEQVFTQLSFTTDLVEGAKEADLVIEAITEKLDVKRELFSELDKITPAHTILATNSSTIVNSLLAEVTERPEKVCNMHFFFPPLVMQCVEVVMSDQTSEQTAQVALDVCEQMGKKGFLLRKEISGFIANRILIAIQREAIQLYENGIADYEDIDDIVKAALGHKLGPFELIDLSGADVMYYVMAQQYAETGKEQDKPPTCIVEKVTAGELGRKTGKGFYSYEKEQTLKS
ncbi:3-hydroxyacyl-CoA dehydrogenase family protein [Lysinibacillus sp. LZ02]|uniref:3-hydroxyacyl-CoA dehydrogenase family protein n=1 Tax=Lysinibacillus sp. LZ02 TaxID=3420668 RepID=UPI003D35B739